MAGSIDQVERMIFPEALNRCRRNRDPSLTLLGLPVRNGIAIIDVTDPMAPAGAKKNTFGERCLAGIDVSDNAEIPQLR